MVDETERGRPIVSRRVSTITPSNNPREASRLFHGVVHSGFTSTSTPSKKSTQVPLPMQLKPVDGDDSLSGTWRPRSDGVPENTHLTRRKPHLVPHICARISLGNSCLTSKSIDGPPMKPYDIMMFTLCHHALPTIL